MRRFLPLTAALALMVSTASTALGAEMNLIYDEIYHYYNEEDVFLEINGDPIETKEMPPVILMDRTLVPVREVFEAVGAEVEWLGETSQTKITYDGTEVLFTTGSPVVYMGRSKIAIPETDPMPMIINDKTMVPIRIVANLLGFEVEWDKARRTVMLVDDTYEKPPVKPADKPSVNPETPPVTQTANTISKIYCTKSADGADLIYLAYTNPVSPSVYRYSDPNRVVMDFKGAVFTAENQTESFDGSFIKAVRGANHDNMTRIVLDVTGNQPNIELMKSSTGIVIIVRKSILKPSIKIGDLINGAEYVPPKLSEVTGSNPAEGENNGDNQINLDTNGTVDTTTSRSFDYNAIIIDAGHGGTDPGAIGGNAKESEINLAISKKVVAKLEAAGYRVVTTRSGDTYPTLQDRVDIASKKTDGKIPAIFVSIHCNSFDNSSTNGTQVYYHPDSKYGTILAQNIYNANVSGTNLRPGQIHDGSHLFVIRKTLQPAALVETAFISNQSDREYLTSEEGQEALAQGIFTGIVQTLEKMKEDKGI